MKKKPKGITEAEEVTLSGYDLDESNAKKIDDYIQKHPDCARAFCRELNVSGSSDSSKRFWIFFASAGLSGLSSRPSLIFSSSYSDANRPFLML